MCAEKVVQAAWGLWAPCSGGKKSASSYMQKGWKSCSPCGMCLKTRFFSWKVEFFYRIARSDLACFFSGRLSPPRTGAWTKGCRIGPERLNSSSWETRARVQPESWYNFQRKISSLVVNIVSSSWLTVDLEIAALKRLEYALWKVIKMHKTPSTGYEHNVKIWNFYKIHR